MPGFVHIVDDDASFRKAMERLLKHAGYEVATYPAAQHLLDHLPADAILGCILLDVRIPGLSGPELQERLIELGSTLPIIFLTGYPDIRTTVRTIKGGADDFLTKPVPSDVLINAIERAIAHHELTRSLRSKQDTVCARIAALTRGVGEGPGGGHAGLNHVRYLYRLLPHIFATLAKACTHPAKNKSVLRWLPLEPTRR
ncbi:response regulator transcription factor [Bradyrhizobium valentinum]|uniref:response regulator transcription factor n=1 Tax=Bradyrhizobium valentinum TaxID=1518501 RepID=UPI0009E76F6D|nr:response regulator [Bradyrhizobium valentinum]